MSMFDNIARFAASQRRARAERRTARIIEQLPQDVQKDIGWRWTPRGPGRPMARHFDFVGQ
ncbi:MAG: hypothetical protein AB7S80_18810 [Rhizobiaceae bacterium]